MWCRLVSLHTLIDNQRFTERSFTTHIMRSCRFNSLTTYVFLGISSPLLPEHQFTNHILTPNSWTIFFVSAMVVNNWFKLSMLMQSSPFDEVCAVFPRAAFFPSGLAPYPSPYPEDPLSALEGLDLDQLFVDVDEERQWPVRFSHQGRFFWG